MPVIRPLRGAAELAACVELQQATWGPDFSDVVPVSMLEIAQEMGGICSGAFDGDRLVGFVFGVTGLRDGRLAHWSDMLAVLPEYRGQGLGHRLKAHQRELLLERGVDRMFWTFDPLVARNAHLNLRRLGAIAATYRRDAYALSNSPLHAGIGTDRLLAEWPMASERVERRLADPDADPVPGAGEAPVLNPPRRLADGVAPGQVARPDGPDADVVRVVVPLDIYAVRRASPEVALEWRRTVRDAFERAFDAGYTAVDLLRQDAWCSYVLIRGFSL